MSSVLKSLTARLLAIAGLVLALVVFAGCSSPDLEATSTARAAPTPTTVSELGVLDLLSSAEIGQVTSEDVSFKQVRDMKALLAEETPERFKGVDAWFSVSYSDRSENRSVSLSVIDFDRAFTANASLHGFRLGLSAEAMEYPVGDSSATAVMGEPATAAIVIFVKGDKHIQIFSDVFEGSDPPLTDIDGLLELARLVESRL